MVGRICGKGVLSGRDQVGVMDGESGDDGIDGATEWNEKSMENG